MPDVAKLKKKAAELELKKQFDKALAVYVTILESYEGKDEEVDVALFNRVGDIYLKQGNVADAVDYYEKAVDHYVDTGFYNNAIALCNKILRSSPSRATIYYKLGKISAHKGFKADAKANFLEYADRMQKSGNTTEAFRALKEFADLCPDQDDIRLMLADQLSKAKRGGEAVEQLQLLHQRYVQDGRTAEAQATIARMKAIDPASEPLQPGNPPRRPTGDLVFLDLEDSGAHVKRNLAKRATQGLKIIATGEQPTVPAPPRQPPAAAAPPAPAAAPAPRRAPAPPPSAADDTMLDLADDGLSPAGLESGTIEPAVLDGMTRVNDSVEQDAGPSAGLLDGLQTSPFDDGSSMVSSESLLDMEPTTLDASDDVSRDDRLLDFDASQLAPPGASARDIGARGRPAAPAAFDDSADEPSIGGDLELIMPEDDEPSGDEAAPEAEDIPLMDFELPVPAESTSGVTGTARPASDELEMLDLTEAEPEPAPAPRRAPAPPPPAPAAAKPKAPPAAPPKAAAPPAAKAAPTFRRAAPPAAPAPAPAAPPKAAPAARQAAAPGAQAETLHPSTNQAAHSVELLQAMVDSDPDDNGVHQRLGEALLDVGDREGGLRELETAMVGYERAEDLDAAASLADEIVRLNPGSVRHHQKRVEYAFRLNERGRLIEAYLELADALFRAGQLEKSRAIYQRVLDLAPEDLRAQAALETIPATDEPAAPAAPAPAKGRAAPASRTQPAPQRAAASAATDDAFVNLGDWLRGDEVQRNTRMVVAEQEPSGDEEADFQDMLRKFKQGIAENVDDEDHQSHYDLGVAYKEMGLLDEAIAEFQKALRAPTNRVPTYEALGQCFMEKAQYSMASTILSRALDEKGVSDDHLVGVLYLLGRCAEERGQPGAALEFYQRVFVVDIQFRDVGERLASVEGARS